MDPLDSTERILGLDPLGLLARVQEGAVPDTAALLREWVPPAPEEIAPLFPQLEIGALLGRGGMGAVYRARQPALDREVALKLLPGEAAADAAFAERFRTEARALALMQHPHIVTVYESGQTTAGHLYFVMEYLDGGDLAKVIAEGRLPVRRALGVTRAVCEALECAHARGIIHRDIKPANILLDKDGRVKVADFGLARREAESVNTSRLTTAGASLGTPVYTSPEQRAGGEMDGRADLYSLGVMLYEMLTGELPQGAWHPPSRFGNGNPRLDAVVEQLMAPDPAERPPSAAHVRVKLDRMLRSMTPAVKLRRRVLTGLAAVGVLAGAGWWWQSHRRTENNDEPGPTPRANGPATVQGTHEPLTGLDLQRAAYAGEWYWVDDKPGEILAVAYTQSKPLLKILHLPVVPGTRAYDLSCEVFFENVGSDLVLILPSGRARSALVLDLHDHSGLEFIRQANWKSNETTVVRRIPRGRFLPLALSVRPEGERVTISVRLDGEPFIQWEGLQGDLSLLESEYLSAVVNRRGLALLLQSLKGGIRLRAMRVDIR